MAEVSLGWNNSRLEAGARGAEAIIRRTTAGMEASLSRVRSMDMKTLMGGIGLAAVVTATKEVIKITAEFDSLEKGLLSIEGTQEGVNKRLTELKEVAALPGLGMEEAIKGDINLRAVGLSADLSKRTLIEMGNALANVGGGKAELDGVLLAITQIASNAKVTAQDINQIGGRIPQLRGVMKDAFGTANTEEIQKMKISAEGFITGLVEGFERKIPRATAGLQGSMDALGDSMTESIVTMGKPLGEVLIPQFEQLSNLLEKNQGNIKGFATDAALLTEGLFETAKGAIALTIGLKGIFDGEGFKNKVGWAWGEMHLDSPDKDTPKPKAEPKDSGKNEWSKFTPQPDEGAAKEAAKEMRDIEAARLALAEKQFEVFMSHTSPLLQIEALQKRIKDYQEQAAGRDGPVHELTRIKLQEKIIELQNRERAIHREIRAEEAAKQEKEKEVEARRTRELTLLDAELAIIAAQNAGLQKKADTMRRNLEIAEEAARIQGATGISQVEAIKKATALIDGRAKANGSRDDKGGTAAERQEAARQRQADRQANADQARKDAFQRAYPGMDDWKAKQGKPLREGFQFPGLDRYNALQDRSRPVGAPMPAANGKPAATQEMPTVENLLQQLINTTEGLKEG